MNSETNKTLSRRRLNSRMFAGASLAILGFAMTTAVGGTAYAQDQAAAPSGGGEVVVTGSRIARRDYTSNSPIVTLGSQSFEQTANVALEATLNKLPQFVADKDLQGVNAQDVQPTAVNTIGISTLSLRGLGSNRNLVLMDGRRLTPVNAELNVDLNDIPSSAIDRVEVITGGASAVYGADAVGGVVNFILKKNFQGLDVDGQWGISQAGDGQEFKVSALFGANFADDRGNVMLGVERYTREAYEQKNRDFYTKSWSDPTVGTNEFFDVFNGVQWIGNFPSQAAVDALFSGRPAGTVVSNTSSFWFNSDGTLFSGAASIFGGDSPAGLYRYKGGFNGTTRAIVNVKDAFNGYQVFQAVKTNTTEYDVAAPLNRWSMFGQAHYDITPNLTAYANANFITTHVHTTLFPTPFIFGWTTQVAYDSATNGVASGHPVPTELATLLNSRPNPNAPWIVNVIPETWFPPRSDDVDTTVWQITAGLKGNVPYKDWTFDLYGSHGQSSNYDLGLGEASLQRFVSVVNAPNYGANSSFHGNPGNFGFGTLSVNCTSGFGPTIFSGGAIAPSQDCINAITAKTQTMTQMAQDIIEFNTQGTLFKAPAGDVKLSLGASYRDDSIKFNPDILQSNLSFTDQVAGIYPAAYMDAKTSAREGFGELLVPVLSDLPFVKQFNLELGGRYSTYTARDYLNNLNFSPESGWTYKALGDWQVNDYIRFRGGYNLAVRSPNLAELFLGRQEVFAGGVFTAYGDPCSLNAIAPFGANPAKNTNGATGAANALNICKALMSPVGSTFYYGQPQITPVPGGISFVGEVGNPNLRSEQAQTWTAGVVLRSPVKEGVFSRATLSIDWYSIHIGRAIQFGTVDATKEACLTLDGSTPAAAAISAASPTCQAYVRNPGTGQEDIATIVFGNLGVISTSGIDFDFNWTAELADLGLHSVPGSLNLSILASYLDHFRTGTEGGTQTEWKGTLGPNNAYLIDQGAFDYKLNTTLSYATGPATVSFRWRHLPGAAAATSVVPGNTFLGTGSYDVFDLSGSWTFKKNYVLRAGIDNLFDRDPEITGATVETPTTVASSGQGTTLPGLYDALGRRFFIGLKAKF